MFDVCVLQYSNSVVGVYITPEDAAQAAQHWLDTTHESEAEIQWKLTDSGDAEGIVMNENESHHFLIQRWNVVV